MLAIIIAAYLPDTVSSEPGQTGLGFVLVPIVPLHSALLQGLRHGQTRLFFPVGILDSLWPLWEGRRRALHDLAAGTIVITRRTDTQ